MTVRNEAKRLAILHYAGPPVVGGVESTIYHHAKVLNEIGYQVSVIAGRGGDFDASVRFHRIPEIDSRHPQVLEINRFLKRGEVSAEFNQFRIKLIELLRPILAQVDACIVHNAITLHKNLALTAALRILSDEKLVPLIAWCHDFAWQDKLYIPEMHAGYPWSLLKEPWPTVKYVAVSNHRRARLAELLGLPESEIQVVTPGVDICQFLGLEHLTWELITKLDLLLANPLMLLPARITRRKNIEFAIRLTAALKSLKPDVALVITGPPGPHNPTNVAYLESLKLLCGDLDVECQVNFLYEAGAPGETLVLPDKVVADFYQLADLLIFPSHREGFGMPILEAGLARLPIFATNIPPVNQSVGEYGCLFEPGEAPGVIAQRIVDVLQNDRAHQMRRRVLDRFIWESIIERKVVPLIEEGIRRKKL
ncbi:MAG: glycosyltransferase family 4 protein [Anaerolineales bacterium]|nr:glycosyltransferase family 4 protein [Anaerolineales bacterium]